MSAGRRTDGLERRKRATRGALRSATVDLGLDRGLGDVRVEEIAERAGVSPRTFFNYFDSKEDAALLDVFTVGDEQLAALAAGAGAGVWAELTALFADDVERLGQDGPELPRVMELQRRHPALQGRQLGHFVAFESRLCAAIAVRLGPAPEAPMVAGVMSGSCITAVRVGLQQWGGQAWAGSPRPHVERAFDVLAPAFLPRMQR